jgi:hypothetical protein
MQASTVEISSVFLKKSRDMCAKEKILARA